MINFILKLFLGILFDFLRVFLINLRQAAKDNPDFIGVVESIVSGIDQDHPEWTDEEKREHAFKSVKAYLKEVGKDVRDSLINATIEVAVQKINQIASER